MPSQAQRLSSLFPTIVLAGITALLITSAALPMPAQNSVPPTAVHAARMPQFASGLAHPAHQPTSLPKPVLAPQASRSRPPQDNDIYDNGPINGNTDAWTINSGFIVSDTLTIPSGGGTVTGMSFGAWLFPGDTLTTTELSITSEPNGGTSYFDQTVNFTQGTCTTDQYGYNVCAESTTFNGLMLNAGTYWMNLQNASVPSGDPVYWDENSGAGCMSPGCPSQADNNSVGTIPSESFTLEGNPTCYPNCPPTCYQSGGNLQIIDSFTPQQGSGNGVVIDQAGNLYGTTGGGDNGAGFAYKLSRFAGWLLDPLFSFFGGSTGGPPFGAIIGPNGSLYGGARGGIQNCGTGGSQYCGLVYNLTPQPMACVTALCSWNENVPYRFSSDGDGSGTINVSASDREGNLYGTTSSGGAYGAGTVFELTPSGGGWTKTILYSFTGGNDGDVPTNVLVGNDGNLYGAASGGGSGSGVVFQLTPSGSRWTEGVIYTFTGTYVDGSSPGSLVQDSAGNLYGIAQFPYDQWGEWFVLQQTSSGWAFNQYIVQHGCMPEQIPVETLINLTVDASGNVYGTGTGGENFSRSSGKRRPLGNLCFYNYAFKASHDSNGWHYQDLDFLLNTYFTAGGSLALDPSGNLYGTTSDCGTNNSGTVWQISP
ncbi:MAG: choice-of-anchor tandem repeat GloVer-containing protein [Candidatus Korobacteraceae bacterium]